MSSWKAGCRLLERGGVEDLVLDIDPGAMLRSGIDQASSVTSRGPKATESIPAALAEETALFRRRAPCHVGPRMLQMPALARPRVTAKRRGLFAFHVGHPKASRARQSEFVGVLPSPESDLRHFGPPVCGSSRLLQTECGG